MITFLQAIAGEAVIQRSFVTALGWSTTRAKEGWALLDELSAASVVVPPTLDNPAIAAIAACETWQSTGLARARALLQLTYPEQAQFLFHDFVTQRGMGAVVNVATFLHRRDVLAHGAERKASRKMDAEALAIIAETGTTKQTVTELEALVHAAQTVPERGNAAPTEIELAAARLEALRKIHAWVTTWSDMARTVIKRRDLMIRLGIAKRRARAKAVAVPPVIMPPVITPPVITPPVITPPALASVPAATVEDDGLQSRAA